MNRCYCPSVRKFVRISAQILIFTVILCTVSFANYSGGTGEPNDPYQISNVADLLTLAADVNDYNKCFIMTADIDLDPNLPGNQVFTTAVIACDKNNANYVFDGNAFSGVLDGAGRKITNLTIDTNGTANCYLGLLGCISFNGCIKNLAVEKVIITGGDDSGYLGGLAGQNLGTISNCFSTGTVAGGDYSLMLGGLVGENYQKYGTIVNCFSTSTVTGANEAFCLGALVGDNFHGIINNSYSEGSVAGKDNSYYIGGIVGYSYKGSISNCYSTSDVTGEYLLGGLIGYQPDGSISRSYFLDVAGPNNGFGTPLTDTQMKQQASFVDWDFVWEAVNGPNDVWAICEGVSYPMLAWQYIIGDSDNDKNVDFEDFALMGLKWRQADSTFYCGGTDLTGDEWVDLNDLDAFVENWLEE